MPNAPHDQKIEFVGRERNIVRLAFDLRDAYLELRSQWDSMDYFNTLATNDLADSVHDGITKEQIQAAISALSTISAAIDGQAAGMYPIK